MSAAPRARRRPWRHLKRVGFVGAGLLLIVAGIATFPLPLPIGLPLAAIGLTLVVRNSMTGRRRLAALLARYPRLRGALARLRRGRRRRVAEQAAE
jgi:hypothetical protein